MTDHPSNTRSANDIRQKAQTSTRKAWNQTSNLNLTPNSLKQKVSTINSREQRPNSAKYYNANFTSLHYPPTMSVHIKIIDTKGNIKHELPGEDLISFLDMCEKNHIEFPYSCRAGACFTCAARIKEGGECVDIGKTGLPLVDIEEDQVLTCVAGIKSTCLKDGKDHTITLQQF